jgi:hypothetical protein
VQEAELEERLRRAVQAGRLSPPHPIAQPKGFPFHIATCAVDLPAGCIAPPGSLSRRLGVGCAGTAAGAARLALLEGVERYSLQFHRHMPARLVPFAAVGGTAEPAPVAALALGVPGAHLAVSSKGAAAGADLEAASRRAVLELLEHHRAGAPPWPDGSFLPIDPTPVPPLAAVASWAQDLYRRLDLRLARFDDHFAALAGFSDLDGGRRTTGSAAGLALYDTLTHAAQEAVFHWRNLVALDHAGTAASTLDEEDRAELARYRGSPPSLPWPEVPALCVDSDEALTTVSEDLLATLAALTGRRARLFDMTSSEIGVPVVKALVD